MTVAQHESFTGNISAAGSETINISGDGDITTSLRLKFIVLVTILAILGLLPSVTVPLMLLQRRAMML